VPSASWTEETMKGNRTFLTGRKLQQNTAGMFSSYSEATKM